MTSYYKDCPYCANQGKKKPKKTCENCKGAKKFWVPGVGEKPCRICNGTGEVPKRCPRCDDSKTIKVSRKKGNNKKSGDSPDYSQTNRRSSGS